jgi:hypothetical protein
MGVELGIRGYLFGGFVLVVLVLALLFKHSLK